MNIPDLTGKYKSSDGGSIIITHREKVDGNIYTISVRRYLDQNMKNLISCHHFSSTFDDNGLFTGYNISNDFSNEYKQESKSLKICQLGLRVYEKVGRQLEMVITEFGILDYSAMSQDVSINVDQWKNCGPDNLSLVSLYSTFYFDRATRDMKLVIRAKDGSVLSDQIYTKVNNDITPLWGHLATEEVNDLFNQYRDYFKMVEDREMMNEEDNNLLLAACNDVVGEDEGTQDTVILEESSPAADSSNERELLKLVSGQFDD